MTTCTVAQFLALGASVSAKGATFVIQDTAANLSAAFGVLFQNSNVRSIIVSDNGVLSLPPTEFFEALSPGLYGRVLSLVNGNGTPVHMAALHAETVAVLLAAEAKHAAVAPLVADTAANIVAALGTLNNDAHVTAIYVDKGGPLNLTAAQYLADGHALGEIISATPISVSVAAGSHGQAFVATGQATSWTLNGASNESFTFHAGFGQDLVAGYAPGQDSFSFEHTLFANFAAMFSHASSDGKGDVVITYSPNSTLTLTGVTLAQVQAHASDFHFI